MLFVSHNEIPAERMAEFDNFTYDDYLEWKSRCRHDPGLLEPISCFSLSPSNNYKFKQTFRKPIYGKFSVLKLISADNLFYGYSAPGTNYQSARNIDLQYVGFRGNIGKLSDPFGNLC